MTFHVVLVVELPAATPPSQRTAFRRAMKGLGWRGLAFKSEVWYGQFNNPTYQSVNKEVTSDLNGALQAARLAKVKAVWNVSDVRPRARSK